MARKTADRIVDEMAVALLGVPEIGDDAACRTALRTAGFPDLVIRSRLGEARRLARSARAAEADGWTRLGIWTVDADEVGP